MTPACTTLTHMAHVGIRALQQNASEVVRRAAAGETIDITDRGRLVARLVPVSGDSIDDLLATGQARPATRPITDVLAQQPLPTGEGPTAGEILAEMRQDER
jgi:prevent-host-death family protein